MGVGRRHPLVWLAFSLLLCTLATPVAATTSGSTMARTAIDQCDAVPDHPSQENWEAIGLALTLAEGAVDAAPNDATAHFAVFCSLAKQTALRGFSLQSLLAVHRLHSEIDTALRLDPGYGDALVAKGAFLLNLPRLLGGDAQAAASTLQRAVALEPQRISARLYLAEALESLGSRREAKQQAQAALDAALQAGRQEQADAARALLERLAEQ